MRLVECTAGKLTTIPPVQCYLLNSLSAAAEGEESFAGGWIWDCIIVLKLCYKPKECHSSVSPSFSTLHFTPGHVASPALGATLPKPSKEDKSLQALMNNKSV